MHPTFYEVPRTSLLLVGAGFLLIINVIGPQSVVLVSVKMRASHLSSTKCVTHSRAVYIAKAQRYEEILGLAVNQVYLQCKQGTSPTSPTAPDSPSEKGWLTPSSVVCLPALASAP